MSGFRYWEAACDGLEENGADCMETSNVEWTLGEARKHARADGWRIALPGPNGTRRDLCPKHRDNDRDPMHFAGEKPKREAADG